MKAKLKIKKAFGTMVTKISNKLAQSENQNSDAFEMGVSPEISALVRKTSADGAVLLKNNGALPLDKASSTAVFGRVQFDWFCVGYGSGGDVHAPYRVNLIEGLKGAGVTLDEKLLSTYKNWTEKNPADHGFWGHWPRYHEEMPLDDQAIADAAENNATALVVIGRASGEDRENILEKGSYYLTDAEINILDKVSAKFQKTVVLLDIGTVMDLSWIENYGDKINAVLLLWQGGMESGNAAADLLTGKVTPSGKLPMCIARDYRDYPSADSFGGRAFNFYKEDIFVGYRYFETFKKDAVLFPFGFGLSYANLKIKDVSAEKQGNIISVSATVENTSDAISGKEVVQLYLAAPQGKLGKTEKVLCAYEKTDVIAPGSKQNITLDFDLNDFASYDDEGATEFPYSYVLENGEYKIFIGNNVRESVSALTFKIEKTVLVRRLSQVSAPKFPFERMRATEKDGKPELTYAPAPLSKTNLKDIIVKNLPAAIEMTGDKGYKLADVKNGKVSMDKFVAQLSLEELEAISRGDYKMNSALGASGNAGALGGILPSLREKGVPPVIATDGPSGIRLNATCSLLPIGTLLASCWNKTLIQSLYAEVGKEMQTRGSDILLAPGMNIQRNPLCGRNFEYYSEDPLLTGKTAAAAVKGLQSTGVSACPKHFACNNQEFNRNRNDSRLSERALREIYLKGFEFCVKEAKPENIMTSYNKINGVWGHYNYELCTTVLRNEWGYEGNVVTDWWMRSSKSPEFPSMRDNAYRVRAQVDVLMPGGNMFGARKPDGTLLAGYGKKEGITLGELQRTAKNVLNFAMNSIAIHKKTND